MSIRLNIGCGPKGKDDWTNIDWGILAILHKVPLLEKILIALHLFPKGFNVRWPKNLKLHNCLKRLSYRDSTVDFIYTSHFLEHIKKFEAEKVILDYYRVLKKGGMLRLVVPDMELIIKKYCEKDWEYFKKIGGLMEEIKNLDGSVHFADIVNHFFFPLYNKNRQTSAQKFMNKFMRPHQWMYDFDSMKDILEKAGFKNILKREYREGNFPDIKELDTHPFESLHVEAEK